MDIKRKDFSVICEACGFNSNEKKCKDGHTKTSCKKRIHFISMDKDSDWWGHESKPMESNNCSMLVCERCIPIEIDWKKTIEKLD